MEQNYCICVKINKLQQLFTILLQNMSQQNYVPQMPNICHMPKLLDMYQWGKHANINDAYELTGINNVNGSSVHRWQCRTMMPQPDYIYWVSHMANLVKTQQNDTLIYHATAIYVPATNMHIKCHKYATCPNYSTCIYGGSTPMPRDYDTGDYNILAITTWNLCSKYSPLTAMLICPVITIFYTDVLTIMTWKWANDWLFLNSFALMSVLSGPPHPLKEKLTFS